MFVRKLINKFKALITFKVIRYSNPIEASYYTLLIKKAFGMVVIEHKLESGEVRSRLSYLGLCSFFLWYGLFIFCVYNTYHKDQTILRSLYDTRLRRYGDEYERLATLAYVLYAIWKLAFRLYGNSGLIKYIIEVDSAIAKLGLYIDYNTKGMLSIIACLSQIVVYLVRGLCICVTLNNLNIPIPYEKVYQVAFCDALALILSGHYCFYVLILKDRYCMLNKVLKEIKAQTSWEYTVFVRDKLVKRKAIELQEVYICQKIDLCAALYCKLYDVANKVTAAFGVAVVLTIFLGINNIVLYLFYFMEATASGLFNDLERYVYFLFYVFWQTGYASGIIYMVVIFSENTADEIHNAAYVTHELINSNMSPSVTEAAMRLSLQFIHQKPVFSPCGFFTLDYGFLYQAARSVLTFLVILLQFVMES